MVPLNYPPSFQVANEPNKRKGKPVVWLPWARVPSLSGHEFSPVAAGWREPSSTTLSLGCAHIVRSSQVPTAHTAQTLGGGDALDTGPQRREPMNEYKAVWTFAGFAVS